MRQVVAAVMESEARFLLGKRSHTKAVGAGYWTAISGGIEKGETEEEAVLREVDEEVGLSVKALEKITSFATRDGEAMIHWWWVQVTGGTPQLREEEHDAIGWFTTDEMKKLEYFFTEDLEVFEEVLRRSQV